ncbi:MAG: paraquat-inducible protein A [Burkholderiaceae bacterium]|nr:paraquat-inducible protein A [Burkholderiaceae bacterium]
MTAGTKSAASPSCQWLACAECDALFRRPHPLPAGSSVFCLRCGALLCQPLPEHLDAPLALALAGVITLLLAHLFPVIGLEVQSQMHGITLWGAATHLYDEGAWILSALIVGTTLIFPAAELLAICYLLFPLRMRRIAPGFAMVLKALQSVKPWVMVEVFMLGVLVAVVKLAGVGTIVAGTGMASFFALMALLAGSSLTFPMQSLWEVLSPVPSEMDHQSDESFLTCK